MSAPNVAATAILTASPSPAAVATRLRSRFFQVPDVAALVPGTNFGSSADPFAVDPSSPYFYLFTQMAVSSKDLDDIPLFQTTFSLYNGGSSVGEPAVFQWGGAGIGEFSGSSPASIVQVTSGYQVVALHSAYTNTCSGQGNTGDASGIVSRWSGYCDTIQVVTRFMGWGNLTPPSGVLAQFTHGVIQQPWGSM